MGTNSNRILTTQCTIVGRELRVQVRTDDDGSDNDGHIHLFDPSGRWQNFHLRHAGKTDGSDDIFEAKIPLSAISGLDIQNLRATGFVKFPSGMEAWEDENHVVEAAKKDAKVPLDVEDRRFPSAITNTTVSSGVYSGSVDIGMRKKWQSSGGTVAGGYSAILDIAYHDNRNFFGGAPTVHILLLPVVGMRDSRGRSDNSASAHVVHKRYMDLNHANLVTLTRGSDGVYRNSAGQDGQQRNLAFARVPESFRYDGLRGDRRGLEEMKFALVGPGDKWDSNVSANYTIPINPQMVNY